MKTAVLPLPAVELRSGFLLATALGALVTCLAALPAFQHPRYPIHEQMFSTCAYVALAGLAALRVPHSRGMRTVLWLPAIAHLVVIAFAAVSFIRFGHWPWYGMPDPKTLRLPLLYLLAWLAVLTAIVAIPAGAIALFVSWFGADPAPWRDRVLQLVHGAAVLGFGTWLWLFEYRDRRLLDWLAD